MLEQQLIAAGRPRLRAKRALPFKPSEVEIMQPEVGRAARRPRQGLLQGRISEHIHIQRLTFRHEAQAREITPELFDLGQQQGSGGGVAGASRRAKAAGLELAVGKKALPPAADALQGEQQRMRGDIRQAPEQRLQQGRR